jgi:hypothetical protein
MKKFDIQALVHGAVVGVGSSYLLYLSLPKR